MTVRFLRTVDSWPDSGSTSERRGNERVKCIEAYAYCVSPVSEAKVQVIWSILVVDFIFVYRSIITRSFPVC